MSLPTDCSAQFIARRWKLKAQLFSYELIIRFTAYEFNLPSLFTHQFSKQIVGMMDDDFVTKCYLQFYPLNLYSVYTECSVEKDRLLVY